MVNQHGETEFTRDGQVFISRPRGSFNLEGVKAYEAQFLRDLQPVKHQPWAILDVMTDFAGSEEVLKRNARQFLWCAQENCCCIAIVSESLIITSLTQKYFSEVPLPIAWFEEEQDARVWVDQMLASQGLTKPSSIKLSNPA